MPWQPVPSLLIIAGMINVTALGMWTADRVYYGKRGRQILRDRFEFNLERRDEVVMRYRKDLANAAAAGEKK